MRKFKVVIINPIIGNIENGEKYRGTILQLTPILSNHYDVLGDRFRCIEHKKGSMKLTNNDYLLFLKEIW